MENDKVILVIAKGRSILNASFGLCRELQRKGHHIIYLAMDLDREYIEKQGFAFHTFKIPNLEEMEGMVANRNNRIGRFRSKVRQIISGRDFLFDCAGQWLDEVRPSLVLLDTKLWGVSVPMLQRKIPIVNLNITLASFYSPEKPPVFTGLFPEKKPNVLFRLAIQTAWLKILTTQYLKIAKLKIILRIGFGTKKFQSTEAKIKQLGGVLKMTEYGICLVAPEVILNPMLFDFPNLKGQEAEKCYAGICVDETRKDEEFDFDRLEKQKPIIYCAMGSYSSQYPYAKRLCLCLFECMKQLSQYQLVLQTNVLGDLEQYKNIPENVRVFSRVPQLELLKQARVFITHGGCSSIRESILYSTPMIVFPGWHDQPGYAARVVYHGMGLRGNMKTITAKALTSMIREIIENPGYADAVQEMRNKILQRNEVQYAIQFIENHMKKELIPILFT